MNSVTIFLSIVIVLSIIFIIYITLYNNLQAYQIKINEAESIIDENLRKKYDALSNMMNIILDSTELTNKVFKDFENLKNINISSFDFERKLTEVDNLIDKIKLDFPELDNNEVFSSNVNDLYTINERLEATKSFYNKYINLLNKQINRFPSNIVAMIHHIKVKPFFDGKDMFDDEINDFKL